MAAAGTTMERAARRVVMREREQRRSVTHPYILRRAALYIQLDDKDQCFPNGEPAEPLNIPGLPTVVR